MNSVRPQFWCCRQTVLHSRHGPLFRHAERSPAIRRAMDHTQQQSGGHQRFHSYRNRRIQVCTVAFVGLRQRSMGSADAQRRQIEPATTRQFCSAFAHTSEHASVRFVLPKYRQPPLRNTFLYGVISNRVISGVIAPGAKLELSRGNLAQSFQAAVSVGILLISAASSRSACQVS